MKRSVSACLSCLLIFSFSVAMAQPRRTTDNRSPSVDQMEGARPKSFRGSSDLDLRIDDLSRQISNGLAENQKSTIAVVEFVDLKGRITDFGRFLAEKLITRLYQTKKFKVIERQMLNKIVNEQKLSLTGMIDQSTAQQLGKLLGVDAIASGTVTDLGKTLDINARLINTQTAEIFAVASVEIIKDEAVRKLMEESEDPPNADKPTTRADPKTTLKMDAQFFTFEVVQCRLSGTTVICDLLITNNDVERTLTLSSDGSVLFDDLGNSYKGGETRIANSSRESVLVTRVPTKARIVFDGVSSQAVRCPLLTLSFQAREFKTGVRVRKYVEPFKVEFRNVLLR